MLAHCPEHRNTLTRDPAAQGVVPDLVLSGHTGFVYAEPGETPEPGTENAPAMDELISAYQTRYNLGARAISRAPLGGDQWPARLRAVAYRLAGAP